MAIEFEGTTDPVGLEVYDSIEQRRLHVRTSDSVSPTLIDSEQFCFPVDTACSVSTASLVFDQRYSVHLHDENGQTTRSLEVGESASFDDDIRFIGLGGPIKLYCRIESPGQIKTGIDSIHLTFDQRTTIEIGARSLHEQPAGTIRTPDEPKQLMKAVSAFSSALKTTSPERSWPTLRGHPPLIERGPELEIPPAIRQPETVVTISVPPTLQNLYAVAPLSFYLGANIEPGSTAAIKTPSVSHELGVTRRLEDDIARTLKRFLLLDCLVRTEGLYQDDLHERTALEADLPFDLADTYNASISTQLKRYLEVPYDRLEPYIPRWPLTAHVPSTPAGAEILPFIVNELGIVREPRGVITQNKITTNGKTQFVRSARQYRSPSPTDQKNSLTFIEPSVIDESIEHAWFGSHIPRSASKATLEAYQNQLDRKARNESIEILVVCNDARMISEHDMIDETYGTREALPFDVDSRFGVSSEELKLLLTSGGYDFLHYIGHATSDGLQCSDGDLDVRSLSSVNIGVFFLNACQSYEQGLALSRRGAFGGIATVGDIVNEHAVEVGETMARLLNLGFPLRATLELVKNTTTLGSQYLIVGDGSTDIAQSDGGAPTVMSLNRDGVLFDTFFRSYSTKELGVGSATSPNIKTATGKHLIPGKISLSDVSEDELEEYLTWVRMPVLDNNSIMWNDEFGFHGNLNTENPTE
ncbi:hypothetical protein [Natrononativus amylolyticus]|uniref:hypothetical protein n=1 Tax=Natrononativus amylolyticus TaxID=2963434 RepID=UPI0020CD339A|nr:hypothetical protein [Natrononativus amylolyticus]